MKEKPFNAQRPSVTGPGTGRRVSLYHVGWVVLPALIFGCLTTSSYADDRDLLEGWRAKPNVFVILDSGVEMTHDVPTSSLVFPAGADDDGRFANFMERIYGADVLRRRLGPDFRSVLERGSKLHQAKSALREVVDRGTGLNLGFSFFEDESRAAARVKFIYRVGENQLPMLDGSMPGDPIRMGLKGVDGANGETGAHLRFRYGETGDEVFVARSDPFESNRGTGSLPEDGDLRLVSFLVDTGGQGVPRPWAALPMRERRRGHLFYHPAFDFDALPADGWIQSGLLGSRSWRDVAPHLGIDITGDGWREDLRRTVVGAIERHPIGRRDLVVMERYEVFRSRVGWVAALKVDCPVCPAARITEVHYSQHIVSFDDDSKVSDSSSGGSPMCRGFVNGDDPISPIVGLSLPDSITGETVDNRETIQSFLGPQTAPVFFFPSRPESRTLPSHRDYYLPLTETVAAKGNRPLAESLREAHYYFSRSINQWDDPLKRCREDFIIVVTDGGESCEEPEAVCSAAFDLAEVPVYVVLLSDTLDQSVPPSLDCIGPMTGGRLYVVQSEDEVVSALEDIVRDIEQRSRAFVSLVAPPGGSEDRPVFLAKFTPRRGRSIWEGHVQAYSADSLAGMSNGGSLDETEALWDAGDVLAKRWDWGDVLTPSPFGRSTDPRAMYFGVEDGGSWRGCHFAYPGDGPRFFDQRLELGSLLFGRWPEAVEDEHAEDRARLRNTVDFVRGVAVGVDGDGQALTLRDPDIYGWCAAGTGRGSRKCETGEQSQGLEKLGDIYHSRPQVMAYPSCPSCYWTDFHGYREFFSRHRHRRSVLFVGADDGAMHAFDAGIWDPGRGEDAGPHYDVGSGRELFAWVPRSVMGVFPALAGTSSHRWTVDGTPSIADVWIYPDGPSGSEREWRTVLLWGQRRGGRSYVCLDVTEPDPLDEEDERSDGGRTSGSVPSPSVLRDAGCRIGKGDNHCSFPWPLLRWEFTDDSDEDQNGAPDLGSTWSRPAVSFARVVRGGMVEERMIAFFGGGQGEVSPAGFFDGISGNFIYGLDVETGKIVFKSVVDGMVPGDVQLLDYDSDGFAEHVFFGTTNGRVYRVDLESPGILDTTTGRVESWRPSIIFSAGPDQPFFMRPTLVPAFVDFEGNAHLAVLIGSGNRDDLLDENPVAHRFYAFQVQDGGSLSEEDLVGLNPWSSALDVPLLGLGGGNGWYLKLESRGRWEKVVTPALAREGTIVFSTFSPNGGYGSGDEACGPGGLAKTYRVRLSNGNSLPGEDRFEAHSQPTVFVGDSQLFVDSAGSIRVFQVSDDLKLKESLPPSPVSVSLVDWREE
ncbi:MAG: hypothetical protein DRJ61_07415 [Acidobacteria bacterium]|nr:MAG: hypothetical protein DRJ61_07415 [Acidobacteriota bacterium]